MATTTFVGGERIDYAAILPYRTKLIILASVLLCLFLAALDQTIVATALPAIVSDFSGLDLVGWTSTGYLLASTAMIPIYGKLSDIYGRRTILIWGIVVFVIGSILCGMSGSMIQLIIYRAVQGIGAAALTSTAFAIPADLFVASERPRYMGLFGATFGLASVIGPFLGGLLTDRLSWHWVFYVNLPVGLIALTFVLLKMPRLASGLRAPIDWLGTVLIILAVVPLLLGLTLDKTLYPWTSSLILTLFGVATVATALFLYVETRVASPVISLGLFRDRTYTVAIIASVLNGAVFFAALLFLSLFMVNALGTSATTAGTAQIPLMMAFVASSVAASAVVQRFGRYKVMILIGFGLMLLGFVLLARIDETSSTWDVAWRMVLLGLGLGPALPLLNLALQNAVPFQQIGAATASRQFFQQLGQAVGAAVFGVVLSTSLTAQLATNLTPVVAQLPPQLQAQIDLVQLRNSNVAAEGASGGPLQLDDRLAAAAAAPFARQRELLPTAIQDGDEQARRTLLADPQLPSGLKETLTSPVPADLQARTQELNAARAQVDAAEAREVQAARASGEQVTQAVRRSFAVSIAGIYSYAIWMVVVALVLVAFWLPELPLRKSNSTEARTPAFE